MFGHAMKCDVCQHVDLVEPGDAILMDDLTVPPNWVRVYANRPRRYNWDKSMVPSNIERAYDCCSLSCARSALGEHDDNISQRQDAVDELRKEMAASE